MTQYTNEAQIVIEEANKTSVEALDESKERKGFFNEMETLSLFAGCMGNVSINNETLDFDSATTSEYVETLSCPAKVGQDLNNSRHFLTHAGHIARTRFLGYRAAFFLCFSTMNFLTSVSFSFRTGQIAAVLLIVSTETLVSASCLWR